MQEKIANLEIKIFYDSAITKKKLRELSKRQRARSVHGTLQVAGRGPGSDTQKTRPGNPHPPPAAAPGAEAASGQHHSAATFQEGQRTGPAPARHLPEGPACSAGDRHVTSAWHTDRPECSRHRARGPPGSPPLHSPPTGVGSTLSWGSRGTTSSLMSERPQCHRSPLEGSPRRRPGSRQKPWCSQQAAPTCS